MNEPRFPFGWMIVYSIGFAALILTIQFQIEGAKTRLARIEHILTSPVPVEVTLPNGKRTVVTIRLLEPEKSVQEIVTPDGLRIRVESRRVTPDEETAP